MKSGQFSSFLPLSTKRLKLRFLEESDKKAIFKMRSLEENSKYIARPLMKNEDDAKAFIIKINQGIKENKWLFWGITGLESGELIGTVTIWQFKENPCKAELGYEMLTQFKGKGLMSEALEAVISFAFEKLNLEYLEACTAQNNKPSIRLLEKNNFTFVNTLTEKEKSAKEQGLDLAMYRLTNTK